MNRTRLNEIIFLGFPNLHHFNYFMFIIVLIIFIVTINGNALITVLVSTSSLLRSPMFIFLGHLSFSDMLLSSNIVPGMLHMLLFNGATFSFGGCILQVFVYGTSAATECLLLTVMSYDRYLAICKPLHYTMIMNLKLCLQLVALSWMIGLGTTLKTILLLQTLWFCGPNVIDHFFCDMGPLLGLSCSDVSIVNYELFAFSSLVTILPFIFITFTYVHIFLTILRITSVTGRQKTFSTCSSHLAIVCTYYGSLFAMYVVPSKEKTPTVSKMVSLLYVVVTPLCNPIIYSLRNTEIKSAIWKYLSVCKKLQENQHGMHLA
ncbi:olfactory receptor 11L1-like [Hyperolius riggenbachi]|uniref:olfactory receptor 11L1-like n=1 Tax=Hyperolius riggenbachi TaxID=752182 RepID=UPI0035A38F68